MMRVEISLMLGAAILITAGLLFRWASAVFLVIYSHLFLIEKMYYNNHFYLTILVGLLLLLTEAHQCYRLPWPRRKKLNEPQPTAPLWNLVLVRGQVIVLTSLEPSPS